jgi:hypothetical protein
MASLNIFNQKATKDDIKVGYISTERGYITEVNICEANEYAKSNPGTQFIFQTRDEIKYLNINEVNKLTAKDLDVAKGNDCDKIKFDSECGPPQIYFYGGGGVGAKANPIIGEDGSLLAADLVSGGFGYKYPPIVELKDECDIGAGAVLSAVLGEVSETVEYYDQEDDFEDYQICDPEGGGYGKIYDSSGKELGEWDPTLYTSLSKDPIRLEIEKYQNFLKELPNPWWTTRKFTPDQVTSANRISRTKHNVQHPLWGGELANDSYKFKKVTFNVYTHFGKRDNPLAFKFTAQDKSHSFKIKADDFENTAQGQKVTVNLKPNTVYIVTSEGEYEGRGTEQGLASNLGRRSKEKNPAERDLPLTGSVIFADFIKTPNENDDLQLEATIGQFTSEWKGKRGDRGVYNLKYEFKDSSAYRKEAEIDDTFMNRYAISPVPPSEVKGSDYSGIPFTFEWDLNFPYEGDYVFRGVCDDVGEFYLDNVKLADLKNYNNDPFLLKKTISSGVHRIRLDLLNAETKIKVLDTPVVTPPTVKTTDLIDVTFNVYGQGAFEDLSFSFVSEDGKDSFTIKGVSRNRKSRKEKIKVRKNINYKVVAKENSKIFKSVEQGLIQNGKKNKEGGVGTSNKIFADYIGSGNDNDDIQITTSLGTFKSSNVRKVNGDGRNTYNLTFRVEDNPDKNKSDSSSITSKTERAIFNTAKYINKANRSLWRTFPIVGKDGDFTQRYGITPVNPNTKNAKTDDFAGVYTIKWTNINFPVDTNYIVEIAADDNATLTIKGESSETVIRKEGFSSSGKSTGKTSKTYFFKAGNYQIKADLTQVKGKPLANGNPMFLAVNIEAASLSNNTSREVVSSRSWNDNPMGVAFTIEAPDPPTPEEKVPEQEGRCPRNPIWTTRFPNAKSKWYPVRYYGKQYVEEIETAEISQETLKTQEVEFKVYGQGAFKDLGFIFTSVEDNSSFFIKGADKNKKTRIEKIKIRPNVTYKVKAVEDSVKHSFVEQGLINNGQKNKDGRDMEKGVGKAKSIFADYTDTRNDNDDIQITTNLGTFISSNKRLVKNSPRNTYDLTFIYETKTTKKQKDTPGWSQFMNRYAISPIPPLSTKNSDGNGVVYGNSWDLDIPYSGFYALRGTMDDGARVLIDGKEIARGGIISSSKPENLVGIGVINGFNEENPDSTKVFLTKGNHKIEVEVENKTTEIYSLIDQTIFDTKNWITTEKADYIEVVFDVYGQGAIKDLSFNFVSVDGKDSFVLKGAASNREVRKEKIQVRANTTYKVIAKEKSSKHQGIEQGLIQKGKKNKEGGVGTSNKIFADYISTRNDNDDIQVTASLGNFTSSNVRKGGDDKRNTYDLTFKVDDNDAYNLYLGEGIIKKKSQSGVVYEGPKLASYRKGKLGPFLTPAFDSGEEYSERFNGASWVLKWSDVDFPEAGEYTIKAEVDDELRIDIQNLITGGYDNIMQAKVSQGVQTGTFTVSSKGKKNIEMVLKNTKGGNTFQRNPVVFSVVITKNVNVKSQESKSWIDNPIGISAILIPPPCPKRVSGKGVITDVLIIEPGNDFSPPPPLLPPPPVTLPQEVPTPPILGAPPTPPILGAPPTPPILGAPIYPVALTLKDVLIPDPGINYNCGVDKIQIIPDNGAVLDYECDSFGRIAKVNVRNGGFGFTRLPEITIPSLTGVNVELIPILEPIRDPIVVDPTKLIQVTDLVGLKQTGYINGRPYYGAVFYKEGIRYAGYYETPGQLVQIYTTLQESIDARVTTPASAIQRQGTDVTSNDPRLNIPGTPENLI